MRKTKNAIIKRIAAFGLAAAMVFGGNTAFTAISHAEEQNNDEYTYLYAQLNWAEYWEAENVYLEDGKSLTDNCEDQDTHGETDKGAFDAVSRATTNHGLHRGSFQCAATLYCDNGESYKLAYWAEDGKSFYTTDGTNISYAKGVLTLADGTITNLQHYEVSGIKYVPVAVKTSDLDSFKQEYQVVENGGILRGGYSENNLKAYTAVAEVTKDTNGLKVAEKNEDGTFSFGKRQTGADSGLKDTGLTKAVKTQESVSEKVGSYGEFIRVDVNNAEDAADGEGYGPLGAKLQAAEWTYYGTDSTYSTPVRVFGTKFAADNWMHKAMGIQLGLTESYRAAIPNDMDGSGYWKVTLYALGYEDTEYKVQVTADQIKLADKEKTDDVSGLQALVDRAEALQQDKYTEQSWDALQAELQEAKDELAKTEHYKANVDEACAHLKDAIEALEEKEVPAPSESAAPTPSDSAAPAPSNSAVPTPSNSTAPAGSATPAPSNSAAPAGSATPAPSGSAVPAGSVTTIVGKVTSVKAASKKKQTAVISWKKAKGADRYEVQYSLKKNMKKAKSKLVSKTSVTITKLKKSKKYYVRVRAISNSGSKKTYGKWSAVSTVKIKK
mgnify:FL=1